jgi:hypothetical protein
MSLYADFVEKEPFVEGVQIFLSEEREEKLIFNISLTLTESTSV